MSPWNRRAQLEHHLGRPLDRPTWAEFALGTVVCVVVMWGTFFGALPRDRALAAAGYDFLIPEIALDAMIPLVPEAAWVYYSYFPGLFLIALMTTVDRRLLVEGIFGYCATALIAIVAFVAWPSRIIQPSLADCATSSCAILREMYAIDGGFNAMPSLHVAGPVFTAMMFRRYWPAASIPAGLFALAICVSVLLTKRHYVLDVPAGVAVGMIAEPISRLARHVFPSLYHRTTAPGASNE